MAGDWIKMTVHLDTDPSVIQMAVALGLGELDVIGRLWKVWAWADTHSLDGNNVSVTCAYLDRITNCPGFAKAMRDARWLEGRDNALSFPRFDRHNGQPAKKRALTKDRVAEHRNASSVTRVTPQALPEKRREEINSESGLPAALLSEGFPEAWPRWLRHLESKGVVPSPEQLEATLVQCSAWGAARAVQLVNRAIRMGWKTILEDDELAHVPRVGRSAPKPVPRPARPREPVAPAPWAPQLKELIGILGSIDLTKVPPGLHRGSDLSGYGLLMAADLERLRGLRAVLPHEALQQLDGVESRLLDGLLHERQAA